MTAVGFAMTLAFAFIAQVCDTAGARTAEKTSLAFMAIGLLLFLSGITTWLWRVMP